MKFNHNLLLAFILALVKLNDCSPIQTNCTTVESIDGSVGVECSRTRQPNDAFDPTIIEQHSIDLFTRAKRDNLEAQTSESMSDLFMQNLAVMNQANMSDCMARVNCEEKCDFATRGIIRESDLEAIVDDEHQLPEYVKKFYDAGRRGFLFSRRDECHNCNAFYNKCEKMQYDYTVRTNNLYKDLIRRNVTLFERDSDDIPADIAYLHHSMRFLDLANLTKCYARVACETTCRHVKENENPEQPPQTSPFLQNDPKKPASVDIIHNGALIGYHLALNGVCNECADHYTDCTPDKYSIAHSSSIIFG